MTKSLRIRLVSFLTVLSILLTPISVFASADSEHTESTENIALSYVNDGSTAESLPSAELGPIIGKTEPDLKSLLGDECRILEYVDKTAFEGSSHISRIPEQERLNTYVFRNKDGTKSVYFMDENVKYLDADGTVKEKDISLVKKDGGYATARNEFELLIPDNADKGIAMEYSGYNVKITPLSENSASVAVKENNSVVYNGCFGDDTSLRYTPMLSGIKEDVILHSYVIDPSFDFMLETDGLFLYNSNGDYYLAESEFSDKVFSLGKILVYDAVGKPEYGEMTVETVEEGSKYRLTLTVNDEYLSDPETVYPVTIDPTVTISDSVEAGAIEDTVLFSGKPAKNYGDYVYLSIGYVDSAYQVGRVAVRLPGLYGSSEYNNTAAADFTSVKFYCYDTSGNSSQYVDLYYMTKSWTETTATWNDHSTSYSSSTSWGASMSSASWTAFDITDIVQGWKYTAINPNHGFMLVNSNESSASYKKAPYSSEYSNSDYRPYVVMTYESDDPTITLNYSELSIPEVAPTTFTATTNPANVTVTWTSSNTGVGTINSSTGSFTAVRAGTTVVTGSFTYGGKTYSASCTVYVFLTNGVYYFDNVGNNYRIQLPATTSYQENTSLVVKSSDGTTTSIRSQLFKITYLNKGLYSIRSMLDSKMGWAMDGTSVICKTIGTSDSSVPYLAKWYIKAHSGGYYIYNANGTNYTVTFPSVPATSTKIELQSYSSTNTLQSWTPKRVLTEYNGVDIRNTISTLVVGDTFRFTATVYSTIYREYGQNGITWSVTNGTGSATINSSTGVLNAVSAGTVTVTATYTRSSTQSWSATYTVLLIPFIDGMYFIKNSVTSKNIQPDNNGDTHLEQHDYSNLSVMQRWELIYTSNSYYKIRSISSGLYLTAPDNNIDGENIIQQSYSSSISNRQLWKFTEISSGQYQIKAKAWENSSLVLAVGAGLNVDGINIVQASNTSERIIWSISGITYSYVNRYDSTLVGDSELIQYISDANEFANIVYRNLCNISFVMDGSASLYSNILADQCTTGVNASCDNSICGTNCDENHHKNAVRLSNLLYNDSREDEHIYVMWSNRQYHTYCYEENGVHTTVGWIGAVYNNRPVIHFMTIDGTEEVQKACMTLNLVHETAHTFNMADVYDNVGHDVDNKTECVMEHFDPNNAYEFYQKVLNGETEPFCPSCSVTLRELAMSKVIEGN